MTADTIEAPLDLRAVWQRWRFPVIVIVLALAAAVALAAVENAPPQRPLDPRDASPVGARALAQLLQQRGVSVDAVASVPVDLAETTVFVPDPQSLTIAELAGLNASDADLVVVAPQGRELDALALDARPADQIRERTVRPGCRLPAATIAGDIRFSGTTYDASTSLSACYATGSGVGLLSAPRRDHFIVAVGSARVWTNERLGDNGDAALALSLLSTNPRLVWLLPKPPTLSPSDRDHKGLFSLLPSRLLWALLQLIVVVLVLAAWRARRLGPVVGEALPVVVPAAETVRGRARLMRAARARGTAAGELRMATVRRLGEMLGLGPDAPRAAVVAAVAGRTGRGANDVDELLYGTDPPDDAALVTLATALDELEATTKGRR
jgi:hypothetical protein